MFFLFARMVWRTIFLFIYDSVNWINPITNCSESFLLTNYDFFVHMDPIYQEFLNLWPLIAWSISKSPSFASHFICPSPLFFCKRREYSSKRLHRKYTNWALLPSLHSNFIWSINVFTQTSLRVNTYSRYYLLLHRWFHKLGLTAWRVFCTWYGWRSKHRKKTTFGFNYMLTANSTYPLQEKNNGMTWTDQSPLTNPIKLDSSLRGMYEKYWTFIPLFIYSIHYSTRLLIF